MKRRDFFRIVALGAITARFGNLEKILASDVLDRLGLEQFWR